MSDPKLFRDMTRDEKLALCEAVIDGVEIEYFSPCIGWSVTLKEFFKPFTSYRIAPPKLIATEWPWEHMADWVKFVAMDKDGRWFGYDAKPNPGDRAWSCRGYGSLLSRKPTVIGNMPWDQTLTARPDGV